MAVGDIAELTAFLQAFPQRIAEEALQLRAWVWELYPSANELIYDNYNALAIGWGLSDKLGDVFCGIAVYSHINFGFNRGNELRDERHLLKGDGKQYRYILHNNNFPYDYVKQLLQQAHDIALAGYIVKHGKEPSESGCTIVKSVSEKKRRPQL